MPIVRNDLAWIEFAGEALPLLTPGEVLREEYMRPLGLSVRALASEIRVSPIQITEIVTGKRAISIQMAIMLGRRFGTSGQFWMNMQYSYDLALAERARSSAV